MGPVFYTEPGALDRSAMDRRRAVPRAFDPDGSRSVIPWRVARAVFDGVTSAAGTSTAVVFFDGFNHLPDILVRPGAQSLEVEITRRFPALRMYGGDLAVPTPWFTFKGEAGLFASSDSESDDYALYVFQFERQTGEWLLTGGYAGEVIVNRRTVANFAPDRGMTRSIIARASYTIDPNRSAALEGSIATERGRGLRQRASTRGCKASIGAPRWLALCSPAKRPTFWVSTSVILTSQCRSAIVSSLVDQRHLAASAQPRSDDRAW